MIDDDDVAGLVAEARDNRPVQTISVLYERLDKLADALEREHHTRLEAQARFEPEGNRMTYVVMRRPVLQEDEGRHFAMGTAKTRQEALMLIYENVGYFSIEDYYILECNDAEI